MSGERTQIRVPTERRAITQAIQYRAASKGSFQVHLKLMLVQCCRRPDYKPRFLADHRYFHRGSRFLNAREFAVDLETAECGNAKRPLVYCPVANRVGNPPLESYREQDCDS